MKSPEFNNYANKYKNSISYINSLDDWVYLRNLSKNKGRVLDIGCGSGNLLAKLDKYFDSAFGIDISENLIHIAKEKYPKLNLVVGDANILPYENEYFDMVTSHTTFHHLDRAKAVEEVKRVLKPGGIALIIDVVYDDRKLMRPLTKLLFRTIYSKVKLILLYGLKAASQSWEYCEGEEWRNHRIEDKKLEFTIHESREFYSNLLPGAKFKLVNFLMDAIIWQK